MDLEQAITALDQIRQEIEYTRKQISTFQAKHRKLILDRTRLERIISQPPSGETGGSDTWYVHARDLRPYIEQCLERETQTALSHRTKVHTRTLRKIVAGEQQYITLRVADRLLTANGDSDILNHLRLIPAIEVLGNPYIGRPRSKKDTPGALSGGP